MTRRMGGGPAESGRPVTGAFIAAPPDCGVYDHHHYVCHPDWTGHDDRIACRDCLRDHPAAAEAYGAPKRRLAVARSG